MPFFQLCSADTDLCATVKKAPKGFSTPTATRSCGAKYVALASATTGETDDVKRSALSLLHVFYRAHVALNVDADFVACVDETSTAELATSARQLLCMRQSQGCSSAYPTSKQETSTPYVARALLVRLHGLVKAHERFLTWMRTWPTAGVSEALKNATREDIFLADAATFLRTLPLPDDLQTSATSRPATEGHAPSRQSSYAQLISANLYAISTFVDTTVTAETVTQPPTPYSSSPRGQREHCFLYQPLQTAALLLLYYLATLTVDVVESTVMCCCQLEELHSVHDNDRLLVCCVQGPVDLSTNSTPGVELDAAHSSSVATPSLHVLLYTVLQQEGSHLLALLLHCERPKEEWQGEMFDTEPTHRRLLTRHLLRRLGHLFFHPLRFDCTRVGVTSYTSPVAASDRTDVAIITWMADRLQCIVRLSDATTEGEGPASTCPAFFPAMTGDEYRPSRFEAEILAELLRLLIAQVATETSVSPVEGEYEHHCPSGALCSSCGGISRRGSAAAEGLTNLSRQTEYLTLLSAAMVVSSSLDSAALSLYSARGALVKARECVVRFALNSIM
ncbi:hypothetical protein, unknown function [Leishmania tarentolae]|uniref:Uncharacterized protein n=1 Tax=Leishmania tarentolae TaxID=5689 RepID=A0A640KIK8_LEITA|nr:hypothetical protein, unknown function [Leishmania tarentolae]